MLQAHLDRFWIANYRDKRTGEAMVADHKMLHKIPIVRSAAETFLRGDQREGLHFVPRAIRVWPILLLLPFLAVNNGKVLKMNSLAGRRLGREDLNLRSPDRAGPEKYEECSGNGELRGEQ